MSHSQRIIVGVSGASGAIYARRLVQCLCEAEVEVRLVITPNGKRLFHDELEVAEPSARTLLGRENSKLLLHPYRDVGDVLASGSFLTDGMVICPCSSHTLGAIAAGLGDNLLHRAAQVTIKEARRLVLVPREMPMSRIDLQNALRLSECGVVICPASPGFYMMPATIDDLVDFVVGKLLDLLSVPHSLNTRWAQQARPTTAPPRSDVSTPAGHDGDEVVD